MRRRNLIYSYSGQSLIEVLIAVAVFLLTISAVVLMFFGGHSTIGNSIVREQALQKAHDGVEALRILRDKKWPAFTDGMHGIVLLASESWDLSSSNFDAGNGFTRKASISTDFFGIKHIDVIVSWNDGFSGEEKIELSLTLSPPNQGVVGNWSIPCVSGKADGNPGSKGTDVFYLNNKAYVTSSEESVNKADFYIFDVLDTKNPYKISSLNVEEGLKSVSVKGNYAYVIEGESPDFFVIDVNSAIAPVKIAKLTLPGNAKGRYVFAYYDKVYAVTSLNSSGAELFEINVSVPTAPSISRSLEINADVNEVSVLQNIAYLVTSSDTQEVKLIDIPSFTQIGSYDLPGTADATSIHAKSRSRIYVGRAASATEKEFYVLDAVNPSSLVLKGSFEVGSTLHSLISASTLTFAGTDNPNSEFQVYNVRDAESISQNAVLNFSNIGTGADYYNNIVYMSVRNVDILQLVTSTINGICGGQI